MAAQVTYETLALHQLPIKIPLRFITKPFARVMCHHDIGIVLV